MCNVAFEAVISPFFLYFIQKLRPLYHPPTFTFGDPDWSENPQADAVLQFIGFAQARSGFALALAVVPPLLCLLGAFAEAQYVASKRPACSGQPTAPVQLPVRLQLGSRPEQEPQAPAQYSLPGSCLAVCLACAALIWPSVAAFPYAVSVVVAICCWALQWQLDALPRALVASLQAYSELVDEAVEGEVPATPASVQSGEGLLAPGFLGSIPPRRASARLSVSGRRPSMRERPAPVEPPPPAGKMKKHAAYLRVLIPFFLQTCVTTWKDTTADPAFTAVALAAFSMVQPSAAGAACLLLGLWCSLAPAAAGKKLLAAASPLLLLLLALWALASYAATAQMALPSLTSLAPSDAWRAIGLGLGTILWYAGFLAIPAVVYVAGIAVWSWLNAAYLVFLLSHLLWYNAWLAPPPKAALLPFAKHHLLRLYASAHLAALYLMLVDNLEGMPGILHGLLPGSVLSSLGMSEPSMAKGLLPPLLCIVLGTIHAGLGTWLRRSQGLPVVEAFQDADAGHQPRWPCHPAAIIRLGKLTTSAGSLILALLLYVLLIRSCPIALIGICHLPLLVMVFLFPPLRGRYCVVNDMEQPLETSVPHLLHLSSQRFESDSFFKWVEAPTWRWAPMLLLALYATADFLAQYLLAATPLATILPPDVRDFMKVVVGISTDASGLQLALLLLRPLSILASLCLFRFGFVVGTLEVHHEQESMGPTELEQKRAQRQLTFTALCKRILILHSSKLVVLAAFLAAVQQPGALGWLLVGGVVLVCPILSWASGLRIKYRLLVAILTCLDLLATAWMVLQYSVQIPWIQALLGPPEGVLAKLAVWTGLRLNASSRSNLEYMLRAKFLLLLAVNLKQRSLRWWRHLPAAVKQAAGPGSACCLFWPPPGIEVEQHPSLGMWMWIKSSSLFTLLQLAGQDASRRVSQSASRVLHAVDWPVDAEGSRAAEAEPGTSQQGSSTASQSSAARQLRTAWFAAQDQTERFWANWGMEVNLAALLLAAFFALNALSLVYMAIVALGMSLPAGKRRAFWHWAVVPILGLLLLGQYSILLGVPPVDFSTGDNDDGDDDEHHRHWIAHPEQSLQDWLGYGRIDPGALWLLFLSFAACVFQVRYDLWHHRNHNSSTGNDTVEYSHLEETATPHVPNGNALEGTSFEDEDAFDPDQIPVASAPYDRRSRNLQRVSWMPVEHALKPEWSWADWVRYWFYRYYTDGVLVAVVALCALDNDIIHAAYLAIALLLFRQRDQLREQGNFLFKWLVIYNFLVMLTTIVYQAPLYQLLHRNPPDGSEGCTLAHILGLYKLTGSTGQAFTLGLSGTSADLILWLIARIQLRIFRTNSHARAVQCMRDELAEEAQQLVQRQQLDRQAQLEAVMEASFLRTQRERRVQHLKEGISRTNGAIGVDPSLLEIGQGIGSPGAHGRSDAAGPAAHLLQVQASHTLSPSVEHTNKPEQLSLATQGAGQKEPWWWSWTARTWRRSDTDSYLCYSLFFAVFFTDYSLIAVVYHASLFLYAILAQQPSTQFWQAILLYTEGVLIAQYVFLIPTRLECDFLTESVKNALDAVGIHGSAVRCIPIFAVYLAVLVHTFNLARVQAAHRTSSRVRLLDLLRETESTSSTLSLHRPQVSTAWIQNIADSSVISCVNCWEFLKRTCTRAERPLHFLKLELALTPRYDLTEEDGQQQLEAQLQDMLDYARDVDQQALGQSQEQAQGPTEDIISAKVGATGLAHTGPLRLVFLQQDQPRSQEHVSVIFEVKAEQGTAASSTLSTLFRFPRLCRSLKPAQQAAQALERWQAVQQAQSLMPPPGTWRQDDGPLDAAALPRIIAAEAHSRPEEDWYAATVFVDLVAFVYTVIRYQAIADSTTSLAEISVVPLDFLLILLLLFTFMVLDRLAYTLGSHFGKATLLWSQMAIFYPFVMNLFWSANTGTHARSDLRIILLLKTLSFTFSALQLRHGYPPPASYRGGQGRHAFVFMRHCNMPGWLGLKIFAAIPFLYELRAILDWACTPTTLRLNDWFKLEDINISLYTVAYDRMTRARKRLGQRQPRYSKLLQGGLLFLGLLLVLWAPLIVFSTGNPSYQVPQITSFSVNATLGSNFTAHGFARAATFPLFSAGERRVQSPWVTNASSIPDVLRDEYAPNQVQLLCASEDSDRFWHVPPPAAQALQSVLERDEVVVAFAWSILRSNPAVSSHGGPLCHGTTNVTLSPQSRSELQDILQGSRQTARLMAVNRSRGGDEDGDPHLYNLFLLLAGDACKPVFLRSSPSDTRSPLNAGVACNITLHGEPRDGNAWWSLTCGAITAKGADILPSQHGWNSCPDGSSGPQLVAVLDRVQGGRLGAALSSFGITGLYITFVFTIGRFLRLGIQDARTRILYEDLPTTKRLAILCQDIYIARAEGQLLLEEELYWALINIFRSPAVLFDLTKKSQ
ncbi:hypothetical protein WJX84_001768 [Apatococcus fuscideae]|uniref:Piezo-type mechanosensitive ion channel component n=1 Tax=Apatococcus fuscideae TaxID=2026836 RepID=A0AAW1T4L1_9CHLO